MSWNLENLLRANAAVDDYKICSDKTESYELFFVHDKLETTRSTDTTETTVTVYVDHDGFRGDSSFKLYVATTEAAQKIADAVKKAGVIKNQMYALPENETLDGVVASNFTEMTPAALAKAMADAVFGAELYAHGSINALEIFVYRHVVSVKNSRGIDKCETKYSAMIEAIPTWNEGESVELYECQRFNRFDVAAGTLTDAELAGKPYFRCVSMSGLQVDVYNDYVGGEVCLAYYCENGETVPMTGISISGKLSAALASMRLSAERTATGNYYGPKLAAFEGIEIV